MTDIPPVSPPYVPSVTQTEVINEVRRLGSFFREGVRVDILGDGTYHVSVQGREHSSHYELKRAARVAAQILKENRKDVA